MRALLAVLLIALSTAAQAELTSGDLIVRWRGWTSGGVTVLDPQGTKKPDAVAFPLPPWPINWAKVPPTVDGTFAPRAVPMRSGEYLYAGRKSSLPPIVRYEPSSGNTAVYTLPSEPYVEGLAEMELFADQCTLAWTAELHWNAAVYITSERMRAIRRFNICTNKPAGDVMLSPEPTDIPRFVRQLPGGDLLVVTNHESRGVVPQRHSEILRYSPSGNLIASFSNPLERQVVELRLTPDGNGFWVSDDTRLLRYDLADVHRPVVDVDVRNWTDGMAVLELAVVNEWRAATAGATGNVIVRWLGWSSEGVNVFDAAGNLLPDRVPFPHPPMPPHEVIPATGQWTPSQSLPMRFGEYLYYGKLLDTPTVLKWNPSSGDATVYTLPQNSPAQSWNFELFSDGCTLAWTVAFAFDTQHAIRRFNICANAAAPDLRLDPEPAGFPHLVRQLPNGDVLVATFRAGPAEILRYNAGGKLVFVYSNPLTRTVEHLNLTPDGTGFWMSDDKRLLRYELGNPEPVVNVQAVFYQQELDPKWILELSVDGEWRAALQPPPPGNPRRRAVPH
jgi:hypothetical protein